MRLLLDTHVVFWAWTDFSRLSNTALQAITNPNAAVFVSTATAWEMAIKVGGGNWDDAVNLVRDFEAHLTTSQFVELPITLDHVRHAGLMATPHRDPFDRLLAAQALLDGLTLVTADPKVQAIGAPHLW